MSDVWSVYRITHVASGRHYVGITRRGVDRRWRQHVDDAGRKRATGNPLHLAIRELGVDAFIRETLFTTLCLEKAGLYEQAFIKQFNCAYPAGFNLTNGGLRGNYHIRSRSDEFRKRASEHAKRIWGTADGRKRASAIKLELYANNPLAREKLRAAQERGWAKTRGSTYKGRPHSEETKKKMRATRLKKASTPEGKAQLLSMLRIRWDKHRRQTAEIGGAIQ